MVIVVDYVSSIYTIMSVAGTAAGLGAFIYRMLTSLKQKQEQRADERAQKIKEETANIALGLKTLYEKKFEDLKGHQDLINGNVKMLTRKLNKILKNQQLESIK